MQGPDLGHLTTVVPLFDDRRVQAFATLAGLLLYRADLATGEVAWVPGLLARLGYTADAIAPTVAWWLDRTHPDDVATVTGFLAEALEGRRTEWALHYRFRRADGSWAHVEGAARLLRDAEGHPVSTEGVVRDVSAQRDAEDALRARETAYRLLAEESRDLICRHAPDGSYRYVSPAIREIAGWDPEELLGRDPYEFFHPDDHARIREESHALALRGELGRIGVVYRFRRRDGGHAWLDTLTRPITAADGAVVELQTSSRDVTERRRLEERLARAQKLEAIGVLAGGVAHDFNNLMTVVRGNAELLTDRLTDPEAQELLAEVREATAHAAALTRQLLIIGRRELTARAPVELAGTIRALATLADRLAGDGTQLAIDAEGPCWIEGDATTIEQVLLNLVANARDAGDGRGAIRVAVAPTTLTTPLAARAGQVPAGTWVRLSVTDDGAGMTDDVLARALEPFFTTKGEGVGTGLGLATVQAVVQRLDGHLTIDSTPGAGTTVSCWLPPAPPPADRPVDGPVANRSGSAVPQVLVVDDEPPVRAVARRALERAGYAVTTAEDGPEALAKLDAGLRPDVVLADVMMPRMSGRALADAILARDPSTPVVFMSGFAREELVLDGRIGQGHPLVHKPFPLDLLVGAVEDALARRR